MALTNEKLEQAARILELRKRARELLPELRAAYESMTSDRGMPQWPMGDPNRIRVPLDKAAALISDLVGEG